ncbi:GNAT family N-acetyltransferase [Pseudonocardia xishanensis]|uniref:GNAT family N-acetyltransferase n=1 Tax=Pseudonocardia xishanensis TaxID=630995 RepID=A0ABP8RHG1_9PSEU
MTPSTITPQVRVLDAGELRASHTLFGHSLHAGPVDDERWSRTTALYEPGRTLGVDGDGGVLAGTAMSFGSRLTVPGGGSVPMAAVTRVGVRADHTRRGLLRALMTAQLRDTAERGEVAATLRATEARIYGRFGYGVASRGRDLTVQPGATFRPDAPTTGGRVRMVTVDEATTLLPALAAGLRSRSARPGAIERTPGWWELSLHRPAADAARGLAVHTGPDGDDGFATWTVTHQGPGFAANELRVGDLHAASPAAEADLWRFLTGVDLVSTVSAPLRPLDDPLDLLLTDPRACSTSSLSDETWLRLVDVPAALAARSWGDAAPVRIGVRDALLPANDGVHVAGDKGATDPAGPAELECDVSGLAMAYLGDRRPSELVASGWWTAHDPAAVARADTLFATTVSPWSGTFF